MTCIYKKEVEKKILQLKKKLPNYTELINEIGNKLLHFKCFAAQYLVMWSKTLGFSKHNNFKLKINVITTKRKDSGMIVGYNKKRISSLKF